MSKIQQAFEAGNYALVRKLATPNDTVLLEKIKTDPKIIYAGLFGLFCVILATVLTVH